MRRLYLEDKKALDKIRNNASYENSEEQFINQHCLEIGKNSERPLYRMRDGTWHEYQSNLGSITEMKMSPSQLSFANVHGYQSPRFRDERESSTVGGRAGLDKAIIRVNSKSSAKNSQIGSVHP